MTASRPTTRQVPSALLLLVVLLLAGIAARAEDNPNDTCLACHADKTLTTKRAGRTVSLYVEGKKFSSSSHGSLACTNCHADLEGKELPHETPLKRVDCGTCHGDEVKQHARSLHGRAVARGDALAPRCASCHGNHDILPAKDPRSPVSPLRVPFTCGKCHREGTPVQTQRPIEQHNIIENYAESIHGEGLLKKGLVVAANCASCHGPKGKGDGPQAASSGGKMIDWTDLSLLAQNATFLYRSDKNLPWCDTAGLIARNDVVLIKVNAEWPERGMTNTDVVKGLIARIVALKQPFGVVQRSPAIANDDNPTRIPSSIIAGFH